MTVIARAARRALWVLRRRGAVCAVLAVAAMAPLTGVSAHTVKHRHAGLIAPHPGPGCQPEAFDLIPPHLRPCYSLDDCDRKAFDESGTRGRMGLGADPAHPEGPGNFSD